mgnify:CR=1 FL=1
MINTARRAISIAVCIIVSVMLVACSGKDTVMNIDGFDVTRDIYRYVVVNSRLDIESAHGGADVWKSDEADTAERELSDSIKLYLSKLYTVCSLGRELGVEWNCDEIKASAVLERNSAVEDAGSEKEFQRQLESTYMNDDVYDFIVSNNILNEELPSLIAASDKVASSAELLRELFLGDSFVRVKQILVGGENAGTSEENRARAERILARLRDGEDFDELSREYNNDLYMFQNDDGYYIMRGTRSEAFEEAAFSLGVGEISDIIETDAGYSIIMRCEKDEGYFDRHADLVEAEYTETLYTERFEERQAEILAAVTELPDGTDIRTLS